MLKVVKHTKTEDEEENMTDNVIQLVSTGDKGPSDPNDWLSKLEIGTVFLIQDRNTHDFNLGMFMVQGKEELESNKTAVFLTSNNPSPMKVAVNPSRFCQKYSLYGVLAVIKEPSEPTFEEETSSIDDSVDETKDNDTPPAGR